MGKRRIVGIVTIVLIFLSLVGSASYFAGQRAIELHGLNPALAYALLPLIITGEIGVAICLFWPLKKKAGGNSDGS